MPPAVALVTTVFTAVGAAGAAVGGAIGGLVGAAGIGAAVGAGIATGALAGAIIGGATAAITGGDIGDGILKGALFGGVGGGVLGGMSGLSEGVKTFMATAKSDGVFSAMSETYGNAIASMSGTTGTMQGMTATQTQPTGAPGMGPANPLSPEANSLITKKDFTGVTKTTTTTPQATATFTPQVTDFSNVGMVNGKMGLMEPKMAAVSTPGGPASSSSQGLFEFIAAENEKNRAFLTKAGKTQALWNAGAGFAQNLAEGYAQEDEDRPKTETTRTPRRGLMQINERRRPSTTYTTTKR